LQSMGVDRQKAVSSAMDMLRQPGGLQTAIGKSASSIDQLAQSMTAQGGQARTQAQAQAKAAQAERARAAQMAQIQGVVGGGAGMGAPVAMAQPVPPPVDTMQYAPGTPGAVNQLFAQQQAQPTPALNALTQAPSMGPAAPAGADPRMAQLSQLDALALQGNDLAAEQAKSMRAAMKFEKDMGSGAPTQGDQYMAVGKNVFDKSQGKFLEPPTPEEVNELKPKLEKGERWNAEEGRVDAVPGSKIYIQQSQKHAKSLQTYKAVDTKSNQMLNKIDAILDPKNAAAFEGNFGGYNAEVTRLLPGENTDLRKKIDSFKSNMKAVGLELMRSGGSIGQMTEREWPIVEQMLGAIDPVLSEEDARMEFERIKARVEQIVNNASDIYDTEWGETQYYKPIKSPANAGGGVTVTAPDGQVIEFDSQEAADKFKQAMGQ